MKRAGLKTFLIIIAALISCLGSPALFAGSSDSIIIKVTVIDTPPTGTIKINNDAQYTNSTNVTLTLSAEDNPGGSDIDKMKISNTNPDDWSDILEEPYTTTKTWTLTDGDGEKTVYAKFSDKVGNWSAAGDSIILDTIAPQVIPNANVIDSNRIEITYTEEVKDAFVQSNYSITPILGGLTISKSENNTYLITTANVHIPHKIYTITINNVSDLVDNGIDPHHNTVTFVGGSTGSIAPIITINSESEYASFGYSVSTAGDLNGDGYSDIAVSAPHAGNGDSSGRCYIYYGGETIDATVDLTLISESKVASFGYSISTAGDVNGDGYSDIVVSAPNSYNSRIWANPGKVYIYFGGKDMDNIADITMSGEASYDYFGWSVSSGGDVNGDGYDDIVVGASRNDANGTDAGKIYIYFGGKEMDNIVDITMVGEAQRELFGGSVASAGDVNGDGYDDIVVGAIYGNINSEVKRKSGKAYIYFGSNSMDNVADVTMTGEAANDNFGCSVSSAGDVNGDGYCDFIVGASANDENGDNRGKVYIYLGAERVDDIADITMVGDNSRWYFGATVSSIGDVNGDGYGDVIVSNPYKMSSGSVIGKAYVYLGDKEMDNIVDASIVAETASDYFGSVGLAGDVNGDGYDEIIIGASESDDRSGRVYLFKIAPTSPVSDNEPPKLLPSAKFINNHIIEIYYSEEVKGAGFSTNYSIMPTLGKIVVNRRGGAIYRLVVENPIDPDKTYIITASGITDLIGNLIDPNYAIAILTSLPTVYSFHLFDLDSLSPDYTNSRSVKVGMSEINSSGYIIKWLINESPGQPDKAEFVLTQRPTSYTISGSEGKVDIYAWVMNDKDEISQLTGLSHKSIILDITPPTGTISINEGADYTNSRVVTLNVSAEDSTSGLSKMSFSNDNTTYSEPEDFAATKSWILADWVGEKTVYVKFSDEAGNCSDPYFANIFLYSGTNKPPIIRSITPASYSTFLSGEIIDVKTTAYDPDDSYLEYQFSVDGIIKQSWSNSNIYKWQTSSEDSGIANIKYEARDSSGGKAIKEAEIYIFRKPIEPQG